MSQICNEVLLSFFCSSVVYFGVKLISAPASKDFMVTRMSYVTATATVSMLEQLTSTATVSVLEVITTTKTVPVPSPTLTSSPQLPVTVPHLPILDIVFSAIFGVACVLIILGTILRKKSKKLKLFNVPLALGTFCISEYVESNYS